MALPQRQEHGESPTTSPDPYLSEEAMDEKGEFRKEQDSGMQIENKGGLPVPPPGNIKTSEYYHNLRPIEALNLEDWRATEKKLVRMLDWTLLPTLWILYLNNYLDRTNVSAAVKSLIYCRLMEYCEDCSSATKSDSD